MKLEGVRILVSYRDTTYSIVDAAARTLSQNFLPQMGLVQMCLSQREIVLQQGISVECHYTCVLRISISEKKIPGESTAVLSVRGSKQARTNCLHVAATAEEYHF